MPGMISELTEGRKASIEAFGELGVLVESRWRAQDYNENVFSEIAAQALSELNLSARVDPWEIIRWVHKTPNLPEQMDLIGKFGNPPITIYVGPRFFVDVYYWLDGTTTIHQHSFSGAFQVLLGESVHSRYRFEKELEVNPHLLVGKINFNDVSLLSQGDIREIASGSEFIHSLFHLDRPSVTITVRTYKAPGSPVQYSYLKPFLAVNPFFADPSLTKKVQTVSLLLRMKHPDADRFIADLLDESDFHTAFAVLEQAFDFLCHRELEEIIGVSRSRDRFEALLDRARQKHGRLADLLSPVFEESWRQAEITQRRTEIKGQDHRFFLALLLNVPDRATVLQLIKEKFPEHDTIALVVSWVRELSATKVVGSKQPNVLGSAEFNEGHLYVFRGLLEGLTTADIKARAAAAPQQPAVSASSVEDLANHLKTLPLFKSLFCL